MHSNINKLYASNFLAGLVFWYGIEILFLRQIGIDAVGIGTATAVLLAFNIVFDIPSGMLADKWSRKGMLLVATVAMILASIIIGTAHGLGGYVIGQMLYGVYVVSTSGTYQALMYDTLHELGRAKEYSKINGRAYALFLAGAGAANILSGFIADIFSYQAAFFVSVLPCALNALIISSMTEPSFHKPELGQKILRQIKDATTAIANIRLLRSLAIITSALSVVEMFKSDFGQIYMLRYIATPQALGLLWAAYAFTWSLGSLLAHRFHARLNALILAAVLPLVAMAFIDNWISLILFMVQAVASAALINQIETRIQDATPSAVRASILSVLTSIGRAVSIPASFAIGWLMNEYNAFWALRAVAVVAVLILVYWLWISHSVPGAGKSEAIGNS